MADLSGFLITPGSSATINVRKFKIEAKIVDSATGAVVSDLTGPNAVNFPADLVKLSAAQVDALLDRDFFTRLLLMIGGQL